MLAEELKEFRSAHNLSQREFCKIADMKRGTYAQYEAGRASPTNTQMLKIEQGKRRVIAMHELDTLAIEDMHKRAVERYQRVVEMNKPRAKKNKRVLLKWICLAIIVAILVILY